MLIDLIVYSIKELIHKFRRTILTIFAVSVSAIFIAILIIVSENIRLFLFEKIDKDVSNRQITIVSDTNNKLDNNIINSIADKTEAQDLKIMVKYDFKYFPNKDLFQKMENASIRFYESKNSLFTKKEFEAANTKTDLKVGTDSVLVSEDYLELNGISVPTDVIGKPIEISIYNPKNKLPDIYNLSITGIIPKSLLSQLQTSQIADIYIANSFFADCKSEIDSVTFEYQSYNVISSASEYIDQLGYTQIVKKEEVLNAQTESLIYDYIFVFAGFIVAIAAILTVNNSMNISFKERIRYFGMLKAIGFKSSSIWCICFFQGLIISGVGGVLGIIIAHVSCYIIGSTIISKILPFSLNSNGIPLLVTFNSYKNALLILLLMGIISGLLPAIRASKKNPIYSLSFEK